jgi:hypothetical protein
MKLYRYSPFVPACCDSASCTSTFAAICCAMLLLAWQHGVQLTKVNDLLKPSIMLFLSPGLTFQNSIWGSPCVFAFCTDHRMNSEFGLKNRLVLHNRGGECLLRCMLLGFIQNRRFSSLTLNPLMWKIR